MMASSRLEQQPEKITTTKAADVPEAIRALMGNGDFDTVQVEMRAKQDRPPIHPEFGRRALAAKECGVRALKDVPRTGAFRITDPTGELYIDDSTRGELSAWISTIQGVAEAIEARGVGIAPLKAVGKDLQAANPQAIWYRGLDQATSPAEKTRVEKAFAEWADGDSIASHVAYGIEVFCTGDAGKSSGGPSVMDPSNRAWLTATYGIKFMTMRELADHL